ncbi:MAG: NUDIX hydrolase [Rhodospirillaceae bacterium]
MSPALKSAAAAVCRHLPAVLIRWLLRRANTHFIVSAAGLLYNSRGEVLLLRHVFRDRYPWGLPGGFLKSGETPEQGVVRELREETGLEVETAGVAAVNMISPRHMEVVVRGAVDVRQPVRLNHEIFEARFFAASALPDDLPPDHRRRILEYARSPRG